MHIVIDIESEVNSRKNLIRNYSEICNQIHSGERNDFDTDELKRMIDNKKLRIETLLKYKVESKRRLKKIHKQLSDLL